jgi:hypothetical protein
MQNRELQLAYLKLANLPHHQDWQDLHNWSIQIRKMHKLSIPIFLQIINCPNNIKDYASECLLFGRNNRLISRTPNSKGQILRELLQLAKTNYENNLLNMDTSMVNNNYILTDLINEHRSEIFEKYGFNIYITGIDNCIIHVDCNVNLSLFDTEVHIYGESKNKVILDMNKNTLNMLIHDVLDKYELYDDTYIFQINKIKNSRHLYTF